MKEIGLYIHIPFCKKKCLYCDFNSYIIHEEDKYIDSLCKEIKFYFKDDKYRLKTVFIGGGTPTVIKCENIGKIMDSIYPFIKKGGEITIECNPETLKKKSIREYYKMGINRLSIGLQAKQNELLKTIGRIHNYEDFLFAYSLAKAQGFENINIDLMFSLPNQTIKMWEETLINVCNLEPTHISCYSLIVEETTPLYKLVKSGELVIPSEDTDRNMYYLTEEILGYRGYKQYEISNYAKEGYECKHNLIYWKNEEYIGVGAGSHSKLGSRRFWNVNGVNEYVFKIENNKNIIEGYEDIEDINEEDDMWETIFLNLRLNEGLNTDDFFNKYGKGFMDIYGDVVMRLKSDGLLDISNKSIFLTKKGKDLANEVFIKFSK